VTQVQELVDRARAVGIGLRGMRQLVGWGKEDADPGTLADLIEFLLDCGYTFEELDWLIRSEYSRLRYEPWNRRVPFVP
jgi:hypothetical protein